MEKWTQVIAVYGAVVATLVAACNIYINRRDRGRIKMQPVRENLNSGFNAVYFNITNVGRRPISLVYWSVKTAKHYNPIDGITLKETESHKVYAVKPGLKLPKGVEDILEVKDFFVRDSTGKEWSLSRKDRKQFVKSCIEPKN